MKKNKIIIKKPMIKMPYEEMTFIDNEAEQFYYNSFKSIEVEALSRTTFDCCHFENVQFLGDLSRVEFLDCIFVNCDFSNRELTAGGFYRCEFTETKFVGSILNNESLKDIRMTSCLMDLISFTTCLVGPAIFKDCELKDSYFHMIDFKKIKFEESNLTKVNFAESKLKGVNVSTSIIDGITANPYDLKGLVIERQQAYEFCKYLDIEIEKD